MKNKRAEKKIKKFLKIDDYCIKASHRDSHSFFSETDIYNDHYELMLVDGPNSDSDQEKTYENELEKRE